MTTETITLVACVGKKLPHLARAADLYQSTWFKRARRYAELTSDRWYILSAKYGLILPDQVIEPYDVTLNQMSKYERTEWVIPIWKELVRAVLVRDEIVMLAGKHYRDPLQTWLKDVGYTVLVPMVGLGIGQQIKWLNEQIERAEKRFPGGEICQDHR